LHDNQPVTQKEYEIPDNATLMSVTDPQSYISYANASFVGVSGYTIEELQGQPHNVVRHPDMPKEAFADLWSTIKSGLPWTGLVKNRRKNGDHYWVRANVTPVIRHGTPTGYMSVRTKPSRDEIAAAESLYQDFREGRAGNRRFQQGLVVRTGLMKLRSFFQVARVRSRICLLGATFALWLVLAGLLFGLSGLHLAEMSASTVAGLFVLVLLLNQQISDPLERLLKEALDVASGESHTVTPLNRIDEIGMLSRSVGQLGVMFRWLATDVGEQISGVQTASREIAQGNMDLGKRTEAAATSVQQTASAMTQMTSAVQSNAETAHHADSLSASAREAAVKGGASVGDVMETMNDISASAKRITDIIGAIEGIAFQTNILALNAAVEAARAGEQGKGFAVVAQEVRALAQRSADAAKEIKHLIEDSVGKIALGSRLVNEAGQAMDDIVEQVKRVSDLIAAISSATAEQSVGVTQVDQAIGNLDEITQQNAALVEQSMAVSESLRQQATRLVDAVEVFH
jgi:aerotaxis receptor